MLPRWQLPDWIEGTPNAGRIRLTHLLHEPSSRRASAWLWITQPFARSRLLQPNVRWPGKTQFSPGSTSRAGTEESGNKSGRAFFHFADTINRSLMRSTSFCDAVFGNLRRTGAISSTRSQSSQAVSSIDSRGTDGDFGFCGSVTGEVFIIALVSMY
jgi:hypothetical protein